MTLRFRYVDKTKGLPKTVTLDLFGARRAGCTSAATNPLRGFGQRLARWPVGLRAVGPNRRHGWLRAVPERLIKTGSGLFCPCGRLRRLKRYRVLSNSSTQLHPDTQNDKRAPVGDPFVIWRARRDSNSRPPGSKLDQFTVTH